MMPAERVLYLSSEFGKSRLIHLNCFEMNVKKPYDAGIVKDWLDVLRNC